MRQKLLLFFSICAMALNICKAQTAEINGINYRVLSENEVAVIPGSEPYSGDIAIPDNVTINGNRYSVTELADGAFRSNITMGNIVLPSNLKRIGNEAFANCSMLSSIALPDKLLYIGNNAFERCTQLKSVYFPDNVKSIGNEAFRNCSILEEIVLPKNLETLGERAFMSSGVRTITMPDCMVSIGKSAFAYTRAETVHLPNKFTTLGEEMFLNCYSLRKINTENITELPAKVFEGCSMLQLDSIQLRNVVRFGSDALLNSASPVSCRLRKDANYNVSPQSGLKPPTSVFWNSPLKVINTGNFQDLHNDMFFNCQQLETVVITPNTKHIGQNSFAKCTNIQVFDIQPGEIPLQGYFYYDSSTTDFYCSSISIYQELRIGRHFHEYYRNIMPWYRVIVEPGAKVSFYNNITEMPEYALQYLKAQRIEFPNFIKKVHDRGLAGANISEFIFRGVEEIGEDAFYRSYPDLVVFSGTLTRMNKNLFRNSADNYVERLVFESSDFPLIVTGFNYEVTNYIGLMEINREIIGEEIEPFTNYVIKEVRFGEGMVSTSRLELDRTRSIEVVTLPSTMVLIEEKSLGKPKAIVCHAILPPEGVDSNYPTCTLFVPAESIDRYKAHEYWKNCTILPLDDYIKEEWVGVDDISIQQHEANIEVDGKTIRITDISNDCQIYDLWGRTVFSGSAPCEINLEQAGVYIISYGGTSRKVTVF